MKIIDSHAHLTHYPASELRRQIEESGVDSWILGGYDPADWQRQDQLAGTYPEKVFTTYGLHPWHVARNSAEILEEDFKKLSDRLSKSRPLALGECGLDFHKKFSPETFDRQIEYFHRQIELGSSMKIPLILHIVQGSAHDKAASLLQGFSEQGLVHSFSGSFETAKKYLDLGFLLSIGPSILREGHKTLKRAIPRIPPESLTVETDAPDQIADLTGLFEVAKAVAALRGVSSEAVLEKSTENVQRILWKTPHKQSQ